MIIRSLTASGDWTFGNGTNNYLSGNKAIELNIRTRLYSWVGDCFFDMLAGIDWINRLGSKNQKNLLDSDTRRLILSSFGVTGITSFDSNLANNTRAYTSNFAINTINSQSYKMQVAQGVVQNV